MLKNLLFALNATVPMLLLLALGFLIRKARVVDEQFVKTANDFNFKVTIPAMLFVDMAMADFRDTFHPEFLIFCIAVTLISIFGIWGITKLVMRRDKASVGEFVQASFRCSLAINGMALIQNIYGNTSMAGMMMLCSVPLYNICSVILLQVESPRREELQGSRRLRATLLGIVKNPIIIGIIAGFLSSLVGIDYPEFIDKSLNYVGRIGTPFALMCIGADFDFKKAFGKIGKSGLASAIKLIFLPLIFLPVAIGLGFRAEELASILVMLAGPTTPVSFIMAKKYGHEGIISSSAIALTTLLSSLTMALFVFALKSMGYI